ncbi:MAG: hypothetical protein AAF990_17425 [Bacteroidota bacterium]
MNETERFEKLREELSTYRTILAEAADAILDQSVSEYPIFIAHQQASIDIGLLLAAREQVKGDWTVHASTLEEFVTKQLIKADRVDNFKEVYKDPSKYICVFAIQEIGATFVFIPRN